MCAQNDPNWQPSDSLNLNLEGLDQYWHYCPLMLKLVIVCFTSRFLLQSQTLFLFGSFRFKNTFVLTIAWKWFFSNCNDLIDLLLQFHIFNMGCFIHEFQRYRVKSYALNMESGFWHYHHKLNQGLVYKHYKLILKLPQTVSLYLEMSSKTNR